MIKWKRKSGTEIETNETDASIQHALDNGWEQIKPKKAAKKAIDDDNSATNSKRSSGRNRG